MFMLNVVIQIHQKRLFISCSSYLFHLILVSIKPGFHKAIITLCNLSPNSFVLMLRYCAILKVIRYESTSLNRIVADKSHRVIVA